MIGTQFSRTSCEKESGVRSKNEREEEETYLVDLVGRHVR